MEPRRPRRFGLVVLVIALVVIVGMRLLSGGEEPEQEFRQTGVTEEQGKRNAAATPTVRSLSVRFGDDLRILALERHRIDDHDLILEMFPEFPGGAIGCIIVAHAGNEGAVFVEDKTLRVIHEESLETFVERIRDLDPSLVAAFYLSLA